MSSDEVIRFVHRENPDTVILQVDGTQAAWRRSVVSRDTECGATGDVISSGTFAYRLVEGRSVVRLSEAAVEAAEKA